MKHKTFLRALWCTLGICTAITIAHLVYAVYAYQHCSIIQFIAKELW